MKTMASKGGRKVGWIGVGELIWNMKVPCGSWHQNNLNPFGYFNMCLCGLFHEGGMVQADVAQLNYNPWKQASTLHTGSPNNQHNWLIPIYRARMAQHTRVRLGTISQIWPKSPKHQEPWWQRKVQSEAKKSNYSLEWLWPELDTAQWFLGTRHIWSRAGSQVRVWISRDQWLGRATAKVGWDQSSYDVAQGGLWVMLITSLMPIRALYSWQGTALAAESIATHRHFVSKSPPWGSLKKRPSCSSIKSTALHSYSKGSESFKSAKNEL